MDLVEPNNTKAPFYWFHSKLTGSMLEMDSDDTPPSYMQAMEMMHARQRFPKDFAITDPVALGSPKPPEKAYEIVVDFLVSERIADIIAEYAPGEVGIYPFEIAPCKKSRYQLEGRFCFLDIPYIDCLTYVLGDEKPTSAFWREKALAEGKPFPETYREVAEIKLDFDKVGHLNLFRAGSTTTLVSHNLRQKLKKAKIRGLVSLSYMGEFYILKAAAIMSMYNGGKLCPEIRTINR